MDKILRITLIMALAIFLSACGSTSSIKPNYATSTTLDLQEYNSIVILDFEDGTSKKNLPEFAGKKFADIISSAIKSKEIFENVSRDPAAEDSKTLVLHGDITRYAAGNATLKLLIGFGAGSTYFDAFVYFRDSDTQQKVAEIVVDKNSWGLGGAIAANQDIDQFMTEAANKIASELAAAKTKI